MVHCVLKERCAKASRATHYNVITEIYKALITIVRNAILFFALKGQYNLAQGKRTVCATPWVNTAFLSHAPCKGNTLKSNVLHDIRPTFRNSATELGHSLVFYYRLLVMRHPWPKRTAQAKIYPKV